MDFRIETQLRQEISDAWKLVDQYKARAGEVTRAIESVVLPEGYALISIAQLKTWGCYEVVDAMCQYPTQAEKQEPGNGELVGYMHPVAKKAISLADLNEQPEWVRAEWIKGAPLYTRPQDLTAEVERLQNRVRTIEAFWAMRCNDKDSRIAALEEAAREALDALQYKLHVVEAIAKLDAVLGNAEITGGVSRPVD